MASVPVPAGFHLDRERSRVGPLVRATLDAAPLIGLLARKDFHVRYRRAAFGVAWAIVLPLSQALVLAAVLDRVARFEVGISLGAFIFAATLPFSYLTGTIGSAATSIVDNTALSSRVYFPRLVLPLTNVVANLYGFAFGLVALGVVLVAGGDADGLGIELPLLVPALALCVALTTGLALTASALHVYFRDVKYVVAAASTVWFYATPVFYPLDALDGSARTLVVANPATGMVQLFRTALGVDVVSLGPSVAVTAAVSIATIVSGLRLLARWDRVFADLL
jgi:lipopolysaccharide transport system permease protein